MKNVERIRVESVKNSWSARQLERQISSLLFERLLKSRDKEGVIELSNQGLEPSKAADLIKDPYVLEFLDLPESHRLVESKLEEALISRLQEFLLELGSGFAFVGRQVRLTLAGDHFYPDLVFYHVKLKCYVVIDIKVAALSHGDLGQMQMYVHYYDREVTGADDNPTIGLILCTDKNDAMVQYVLDDKSRLIVREETHRNAFVRRMLLREQRVNIKLRACDFRPRSSPMPCDEQTGIGDSVVRRLESCIREMLAPDGEFELFLRSETHTGPQYLGKLERAAEATIPIDGHLGQSTHSSSKFDIRRDRAVGSSLPAKLREGFERSDRIVSNCALMALKFTEAQFQMARQTRRGVLVHRCAAIELNADAVLIRVLPVTAEDPNCIGAHR